MVTLVVSGITFLCIIFNLIENIFHHFAQVPTLARRISQRYKWKST